MTSAQILPLVKCTDTGIFPSAPRSDALCHDFRYDWRRVQDVAAKHSCNLDAFLTVPLAERLSRKALKTPVTFWYTPLGDSFVVSVCSPRRVDFFDPLHRMPGYLEYGATHLHPLARPFLHWDGARVIRIHAVHVRSDSPFLIADFGNGFGLTVSESDEQTYRRIQDDPVAHFEYLAVPNVSPVEVMSGSDVLPVHHVLCVSQWMSGL